MWHFFKIDNQKIENLTKNLSYNIPRKGFSKGNETSARPGFSGDSSNVNKFVARFKTWIELSEFNV